ncbi:hypothetical protein BC777_0299 [Yoonia maricola]|uniref:4-amino-4-deoxy-L-arabinose transferase-like glycosyltransferase n=1 Tax=Yoonia maricola TaxID=420999 RepID=A0A2M8WKL3_9RHOB|nr:hypothetical protein [Yoonia maricola]PJI91471.1 hypothetical protein BC777_0299 [Yoonia maricola]
MPSNLNMRSPIVLTVVLTIVVCSALLILPGATATSRYFNDLLIFLDGGYRVVEGQVPNRDFHTALGPLSFYIPGFGYWVTGNLGTAMPVGLVALMIVTAPLMIHVLYTRVRPLIAVPWAVFLLLLMITPMNTGEIVMNISFAMFYNRIGWALIGLLLIMHLRPERPVRNQFALDTLVATALTLMMLYTKATYGVVALGFLCLTLLQPVQRRWAAATLLIVGLSGAIIEVFWGGTRMHIADLMVASNVSGVLPLRDYVVSLMETSGEYIMFGCLAALALWQKGRFTDFLFYGFCACAGYALLIQNFQIRGIITLLAGGVVAAEHLSRQWRPNLHYGVDMITRGAALVVIVLMIPIGVSSTLALGLHVAMVTSGAGISLNTPNGQDIRVVNTLDQGQFKFYANYAESLEKGADLLASLNPPPAKVLVMDFVSPLTSLAGLEPPQGGTAWMHDGRNFDADFHFTPDELLQGVDVIMIPKRPIAGSTTELMEELYGPYIDKHFKAVRHTGLWRVYRRDNVTPAPVADAGEAQESLIGQFY